MRPSPRALKIWFSGGQNNSSKCLIFWFIHGEAVCLSEGKGMVIRVFNGRLQGLVQLLSILKKNQANELQFNPELKSEFHQIKHSHYAKCI